MPAGTTYQIQSATGINDTGQIVANAIDTATGQTHALLLTPTDQPARTIPAAVPALPRGCGDLGRGGPTSDKA